MTTVAGLFDSFSDANTAYGRLLTLGVTDSDISIITKNDTFTRYRDEDKNAGLGEKEAGGVVTGASAGAVAGTLVGLLAGVGAITIPGIGPVLSAGTIGTVLASSGVGAGVGAASGGLLGALAQMSINEKDAQYYQEAIKNGAVLVLANVEDDMVDETEDVLEEAGANEVENDA